MKRKNLYLEPIPLEEAKNKYFKILEDGFRVVYSETIPVDHALDRVTAEAVYARYSSPLYNCAAMDGIAVTALETKGAEEDHPLLLAPEQFEEIDTGDPLPQGRDAVIMAEDLVVEGEGYRIYQGAHPWQHVRPVGEDIVQGEMVVTASRTLRPMDLGVLKASGHTEIKVYRKPQVAVLPTGTEIISVGSELPERGDIFDSNSIMLAGMAREWGAEAEIFSPEADDYEALKKRIALLAEDYDMLLVNAGTSAGREDYLPSTLRELGEVVVHGVAIKPGKPVVLARIGKTPVIGLPGYPVSAFIAMEAFVRPLLHRLSHRPMLESSHVQATVTRPMVSSLRHEEYVRVRLGKVNNKLVATPLARGAGAAMSLAQADGLCVIPMSKEGLLAGEEADIRLLRPLRDLEKSIVAIGSHDLTLDLIDDLLAQRNQGYRLSSSHVGSMAGLVSLMRKECHIAPTHLLGSDGSYNRQVVEEFFPEPMKLIYGVGRIQGIITQAGNPKNIQGIEDLTRVSFINRQRGAGTRMLLDAKLKELNIDPDSIKGYSHEGTTHMAVAAAVAQGSVDCGLGIQSAADAMGLDFIPVGREDYEFCCRPDFPESPIGQALIEVLTSEIFRTRVEELGGYDTSLSGQVSLINSDCNEAKDL